MYRSVLLGHGESTRIGDQDAIKAAMQPVANQEKAKAQWPK
jgi:hypothetical protein